MTGGVGRGRFSSVRSEHIHRSFEAMFATALYSASVEERTTPCCFFEDHDIGLPPRYIT